MKLLNKFSSFFNNNCFKIFHKWTFNQAKTERTCQKCQRSEFLDIDSDVSPWGNPLWLKKSKTISSANQ